MEEFDRRLLVLREPKQRGLWWAKAKPREESDRATRKTVYGLANWTGGVLSGEAE
jgi:hypothetical protein